MKADAIELILSAGFGAEGMLQNVSNIPKYEIVNPSSNRQF